MNSNKRLRNGLAAVGISLVVLSLMSAWQADVWGETAMSWWFSGVSILSLVGSLIVLVSALVYHTEYVESLGEGS